MLGNISVWFRLKKTKQKFTLQFVMSGFEIWLQVGGDGLSACRSGQRLNEQQSSYKEGKVYKYITPM